MSNFRDGRKNRYRMSGDSTTPERGDTTAIVFFSISIYQEIKTSKLSNTPFSTPLVTWIESTWSWDSKGPLKISRKWRSEVVKSGWEGCEPISMRPDPDWQGSYTISSPGSQSTYTSCSVLTAGYFPPGPDIRLLTFQSLARRSNKHSEVPVSCSNKIL